MKKLYSLLLSIVLLGSMLACDQPSVSSPSTSSSAAPSSAVSSLASSEASTPSQSSSGSVASSVPAESSSASLPSSEDASYEVGLSAQDVEEYVWRLLGTYNQSLLKMDPVQVLSTDYVYLRIADLLNEELVVGFDDLESYISPEDIAFVTSSLDVIPEGPSDPIIHSYSDVLFTLQRVEEMQQAADDIWGTGSIDMETYLSGGDSIWNGYLFSNGVYLRYKDTFFVPVVDPEAYQPIPYARIKDIVITEDKAFVHLNLIEVISAFYYSLDTGHAHDSVDQRWIGDSVDENWYLNNREMPFAEVLSTLRIDPGTLGTYVFTIALKDNRFTLTQVETQSFAWSGLLEGTSENPTPLLPEVSLRYASPCLVNAEGGLNLRLGPDATYASLTILPDKLPISELGYQEADLNWLFVSATVEGKEYFGWVHYDYVHFLGGIAKPVIYLYPEEEMDVHVEVQFAHGGFTCTYPQFPLGGWDVIARTDGTLVNKADGLEYSYLYWEGEGSLSYDMSHGFVVQGSDTATFLQQTLAAMGLTPKEYNEFIVYWLPLMHTNPYNLITFQTTVYTDHATLNIEPAPDSLLRVYMVFHPLDEYRFVPPQEIKPFVRTGFTVIEWGGTMY